MGIFIEDLLNFGNLIDAELEFKLSPEELKKAYPSVDFDIREGILRLLVKKKVLLWEKRVEVRLSEDGEVFKDREGSGQWVFFKVLSKGGLEEVLKLQGFKSEGEKLGVDIMPAVSITDTYLKIPKQFREKLLINRYRLGKDHLLLYFRFEK
ncbi:MAG: hypothetical protein N2648_02670 [Aquificaceae bacterium]|nr:hypothetical protein [Aquificaceae bacterium]MCS7196507.1 hypothetical protein [Aquificaceae bacterium]MCX7989530.1 hypothetical protein [Aquificaceae bacterium]MDW8032694.1 hypothetical protein [Aquificaceae bacterium]MDW8294502.1 hypothetical protein [Aquificaceae bacterium]